MRTALQFLAGLVITPLFAIAVLSAAVLTFTLISHAVTSGGDWEQFEEEFRHYTDRFEVAGDGSVRLHRAEHPVARFVGYTLVSCAAAGGLGYLLERLRRGLMRKGAGIAPAPRV